MWILHESLPLPLLSLPDGVLSTLDTVVWHDCCYRPSLSELLAQTQRMGNPPDTVRNWLRQEAETIAAQREGGTV